MSATQTPEMVDVVPAQDLEHARSEVHRLRLALDAVQTHAGLLAAMAGAKEQHTLGYGLEMLRGIASDALEGA